MQIWLNYALELLYLCLFGYDDDIKANLTEVQSQGGKLIRFANIVSSKEATFYLNENNVTICIICIQKNLQYFR